LLLLSHLGSAQRKAKVKVKVFPSPVWESALCLPPLKWDRLFLPGPNGNLNKSLLHTNAPVLGK
jgi:hypothetical protein